MTSFRRRSLILLCAGALCLLLAQGSFAKKGPSKVPPGQAKKGGNTSGQGGKQGTSDPQGLPPGVTKKPGTTDWQGLPPGIAKKQGIDIPPLGFEQKLRQAWCIAQQGQVNLVLPDDTICDCLTEPYAIAFASEDAWLEAIGKSLHHALTTGRDAAIVLFLQDDETPPYVLQLQALVKHFELPIFIWEETIGLAND